MRDYYMLPIYVLKLVFAQLYVTFFGKRMLERNIWLFSEKKTEARDNGYHFFSYIVQKHPEIDAVYVIRKGWPDVEKVRRLGKVIYYDSFIHCLYYFAAKCRLCSQTHGAQPFEQYSGLIKRLRFYKRKDQQHINLKHGISKDYRSSFDYRLVGFDLYISAVKPEYDYIKEKFAYPDLNIALTGFCRFDALHDLPRPERIILIMPTFRTWLRTSDSSKKVASSAECQRFMSSEYFKRYSQLLTDRQFLDFAKQNEYRIVLYLHYTFQPYTPLFQNLLTAQTEPIITVAHRQEYDVQTLLKQSAVLITDFSSVMFDFAYMHKPIIYYQFDEKEYREKHYQEGYFSYLRDGFGPIITRQDELISFIKRLSVNNMDLMPEYLQRVERFFIPYDKHNCERVYDAIMRLDNETYQKN